MHYLCSTKSDIVNRFDEDIKRACEVMRKGGIILYPTDTVWGIGCDATCSNAVKRIFEIKRRSDSKALIVLLGDPAQMERYVDDVPDVAVQLVELSVKPLTIVYDGARNLAPELVGEDGSVGIRVTHEKFSQKLCLAYGKPIVSTSANISGEATPMKFIDISDDVKMQVDYVVVTRQEDNEPHEPSSIIKLGHDGAVKILRN